MDIFDRVTALVQELEESSVKEAMDDPGHQTGASTHPSAKKPDGGEKQPAPEGEQAKFNEKKVKEELGPASAAARPELTPESAPKAEDSRSDEAKSTGKDPSIERDYKGTKDDAGTSHPASGDFGEKYSSDQLSVMADDDLLKVAVQLGEEALVDIAELATGAQKSAMRTTYRCNKCKDVHEGETCPNCGEHSGLPKQAEAEEPADPEAAENLEKIAAEVVANTIKSASTQAELVALYLNKFAEDVEDVAAAEAAAADEAAAEPSPEGMELLQQMSGAGGGAGDPEAEVAAAAAEGIGDEAAEAAPDDLGEELGDEEALQELAMALLEAGVDPAELSQAAGEGEKIASAVQTYKQSGKFRVEQAKTAKHRQLRDRMKNYILELSRR